MQSLDVSFRLPARHHGQFGRQFQAPHIYTRHHGQFGRQFQAPHIHTRHHGQFGRQFQAPHIYTRHHGQFGRQFQAPYVNRISSVIRVSLQKCCQSFLFQLEDSFS